MGKPIIGIIGHGFVGKSVHHIFKDLCDFRIYDTNLKECQHTILETVTDSDFIFICVPTPMKKDGSFDSSIIDSSIDSVCNYLNGREDKIIIIKSTVVPETTQRYIDKYPDANIMFCPEFLREHHYLEDAENPARIIFGVPDMAKYNESFVRLFRLYESRFPDKKTYICLPTTAEMVKYTANCFLATKVSFFNEIYQICDKLNVSYNSMMQMVLADERIGKSHTQVPGSDGEFGWALSCFPKDLNALIKKAGELGVIPTMMESAWEKNLEVRKKRDWVE